ncbi:MAG TPA: ribonuclease H [Clostridia bacterium]|nr:ribonuclease H [Clostridia bacterium]
MDLYVFNLEIIDKVNNDYLIEISNNEYSTIIEFNYTKRALRIPGNDNIAKFLRNNAYQMNKILRNKRKSTFYIGFKLTIVLRDQKDVTAFNDKSKIIVLDRLAKKRKSYVIDEGKRDVVEVFTDGSFKEIQKTGGLAYIIKDKNGAYSLYKEKSKHKSSSLIELEAAIAAVKRLREEKYIRLITDSQYVRKGLTEWIVNWELNGWKTANGQDVKNKKYWLLFDQLTEGKYIEFEWVKAHSEQFENTLADLFAEEVAIE